MSQQKNNQKVACNMSNLSPILVSIFSFLLLPTGSPLMKLGQFWPFGPPPDHPKWYLTSKSSPQPSISIFRKSKKELAIFYTHIYKVGANSAHKQTDWLRTWFADTALQKSRRIWPTWPCLNQSAWHMSHRNSYVPPCPSVHFINPVLHHAQCIES